jgi:hypothetical protein
VGAKGAHFETYPQCPTIKKDGTRCNGKVFKDHETCAFHRPEVQLNASLARQLSGGARKYPNIQVVEANEADDYVIDNLLNVVEALKQRQDTNDVAREMTTALAALDRAYDRRASRGADITVVEVVYVNDWRAD